MPRICAISISFRNTVEWRNRPHIFFVCFIFMSLYLRSWLKLNGERRNTAEFIIGTISKFVCFRCVRFFFHSYFCVHFHFKPRWLYCFANCSFAICVYMFAWSTMTMTTTVEQLRCAPFFISSLHFIIFFFRLSEIEKIVKAAEMLLWHANGTSWSQRTYSRTPCVAKWKWNARRKHIWEHWRPKAHKW